MYGYAGSSTAASTSTPFASPPPTTDPAGTAGQGASAAQSITSNGPQLMSAVTQALQGMSSAPAATGPSASLTTLLTALTSIIIPLTVVGIPVAAASATASFTSVGVTYRGLAINADRDYAADKGPYTGPGPGAAMLPQWILFGLNVFTQPAPPPPPAPSASGEGTDSSTIGRLSVPPAWARAAPELRPVAYTTPVPVPRRKWWRAYPATGSPTRRSPVRPDAPSAARPASCSGTSP